MSLENEYIEKKEPASKKKSSSTKSKGRKKTTSKKKKQSPIELLRERFANKKLKSSIGMILILGSVFLFIALFSYLLTWRVDQHRVMNVGFWQFMFDGNEEAVANWFGKIGAWFSHLLIYRWFGLASFGIPVFLFAVGFKALFNISLFSLKRAGAAVVLFTVWTSMFLGFFSDKVDYLGGTFGYQLNEWFALAMGRFGTMVLLIGVFYIFILIVFNVNLVTFFKKFLKKAKEADSFDEEEHEVLEEKDLAVVNTIRPEEIEEEKEAELITFEEEKPVEEEVSEVIDETTTLPEIELETEVPAEETTKLEMDDDFQVTIAKEKDEQLTEAEVDEKVTEFGEYDPKLDLSSYVLPSIDLLEDYGGGKSVNVDKSELEANKNKIVETLSNYKIEISKITATIGPTVTLYEIVPAPGVRISKIKNLEDDIALSLAALGIRIIAPIPGKGTIGIEVPNSKPEMVSMRSLIAAKKFQESDFELPVVMGKTITNETYTFDLTKMPHLLVAGATGQGKSVGLNAILVSILYKKHPAQVKFVLVDPKKVELTLYNKIERHFLAKLPDEEDAIITDTSKVVNTLNSLCIEMDARYELLKTAQVRTIKEYNAKFIARKLNPENGHRYLPYIVVLIDEFADLIMTAGKEVEHPIARLAQLARAIGIHLIVATQRPSVNVITGIIKANFPARIAFRVLSKIDSRTILDGSGADQLIGRGDMLISTGQDMVRLQCGFVDTPEVEAICDFIGEQRGYPDALLLPEYEGESAEGGKSVDDDDLDALFPDAARIVVMHQQGSASLLQRKLKLGYNRAGRIVDQLEGMGIIGPHKGSKARDVLYADEQQLEEFLASKGLV